MSTFDILLELFHKIFEDEIDTKDITPDSNLKTDLGMKSIGMLYMAMAIEERFKIRFNNEDFEKITTVRDIIDRIEQ